MSHDSDLRQAVLTELNWAPNMTAAHVGVTASDGIVTLSGHVDNFSSKYSAEATERRPSIAPGAPRPSRFGPMAAKSVSVALPIPGPIAKKRNRLPGPPRRDIGRE